MPSINMGDMGDMGDVGNMSGGGGRIGMVQPDRVDLPFVGDRSGGVGGLDAYDEWTWEPDSEAADGKKIDLNSLVDTSAQWRRRDWAAEWWAWLVVSEFAATSDWRDSIKLKLWAPDYQQQEIDNLIRMAQDERPDALSEIVAQGATYEDFMAYFLSLLKMTPGSCPATYLLLHVAGLVGIMVTMHFKQNPDGKSEGAEGKLPPRARPSQVCPALMPPIAVPGHPSFPSGHATQSMLMALCAGEAMVGRSPPTNGSTSTGGWPSLLQTLARRIATNREIAGLHFRSDSVAGFQLAMKTFNLLKNVPGFATILTNAKKEWSPQASGQAPAAAPEPAPPAE